MRPSSGLVVPPALVPALALLLAGCGAPKAPRDEPRPAATTPQAALEAAKAAAAKHDYAALCQLLTPEAQEDMAAGLVMVSRFILAARPAKGGADKPGAGGLAEKLQEVLARHGLSEGALPKVRIDAKASPEEQARELRKLAAPIKDHPAFIAGVLGVLRQHGDRPNARLIEDNARLKDVKVDGEKATATFVQAREGKESSGPIAFEKVGGGWKISKVPPLMN